MESGASSETIASLNIADEAGPTTLSEASTNRGNGGVLGRHRSCGVLLHPSSLPGPFGIGDFGPAARDWVRELGKVGIRWWQVLPLGPVGYGFSPYSSSSTFAWNPLLISPEDLVAMGLSRREELENSHFPADRVDVAGVTAWKTLVLTWAYSRFLRGETPELKPAFAAFQERESWWLDDYALYQACKDGQGGSSWHDWPDPLRLREPSALANARRDYAQAIDQHKFVQFLADAQWSALRVQARHAGVKIFGDIPIFVADDSCDVWSRPEIFLLDEDRRPRFRAGVPPDYFCPQGQLWGNPIYDWDRLKALGYAWWHRRLGSALRKVDVLRIDHFRGFAASWHVPCDASTAETGSWEPGPGRDLFDSFRTHWGSLPVVAEDLGLITPDVEELREDLGIPGMRVLQFAWDGKPENPYLPHNYDVNTIVYTGTHDNDTTRGWYEHAPSWEKDRVRTYIRSNMDDPVGEMMRLAWSSTARMAVAPMQDVLKHGSESRMNVPGKADGNWCWRFDANAPWRDAIGRLHDLNVQFHRLAQPES